jgi:predicted nucleic acid-binding protein
VARILADTSANYALLDRSDRNHARAVSLARLMRRRRLTPLLTNFVVGETHGLVLSRLGAGLARRWLFGNVWPIERITADDEVRARDILRRYDDKSFSYVDATSFSLMERLGVRQAFSFDPHFEQYGLELFR